VCHAFVAAAGAATCPDGPLCLLFHPPPAVCAAHVRARGAPPLGAEQPQTLLWHALEKRLVDCGAPAGGGGALPAPAPFVTVVWDLDSAALPEPRDLPGSPEPDVLVGTLRGLLRCTVGVAPAAVRVIGFHRPGALAAHDAAGLTAAGVTLMSLEGGERGACLLDHPRALVIAEGAARRATLRRFHEVADAAGRSHAPKVGFEAPPKKGTSVLRYVEGVPVYVRPGEKFLVEKPAEPAAGTVVALKVKKKGQGGASPNFK
jgi:hypothetical protein